MRILLRRIKRELKTAKHCAIYEEELSRVWPDRNEREPKVARFAEDNGFRLRLYRDGLCAIFDKEPGERSNERSFRMRSTVACTGRAGQSSARRSG